jgi:hypothetical protein
MGGIPRVITKLNSFSHNEFDNMFDVSDPPKKFWDTFCSEYFLVDIDTTYPKFIQDNVSYFKDIGFIASPEIL